MAVTSLEMHDIKRDMDSQKEATDKLIEAVDKIRIAVDRLVSAFPDGDTDGHRSFHEALIHKAEKWDKLADAIKEKTLIALIWAALAWAGVAMWHEVTRYIPAIHRTE
jgi:hypothetical protein